MGRIERLLEPVEVTFSAGVDTGHSLWRVKMLIKTKC